MIRFDLFFSMEGFEGHAQIEDEDSAKGAERYLGLIKWLKDHGATSRTPESKSVKSEAKAAKTEGTLVCPIHGKAKEGKGGHLFCPTKLEDGNWCGWSGK